LPIWATAAETKTVATTNRIAGGTGLQREKKLRLTIENLDLKYERFYYKKRISCLNFNATFRAFACCNAGESVSVNLAGQMLFGSSGETFFISLMAIYRDGAAASPSPTE